MMEKLIGMRLGNYEVRALLGSGGMASVYKGYDPALAREVAIKVITTALQSPDFVERFRREARVVANLRHPNIVQVYAFGEEHDLGIVYMVQELLPGATLEQYLRKQGRRRIAADHVQRIIDQLASALDYAHSQGVIHRDVKPSNALYNAHGQLVLTDFGIARSADDARRTATGPGMVMGTPTYVAPEQAISSAALTPACDVYALGVVLFELLTGQVPFQADTPMGVLLKHLYDEPPLPQSLRPDLPPAVAKVVLRALNKEASERYASAGALAQALQAAWATNRPSRATAPARERVAKPNAPAPAGREQVASRATPVATAAATPGQASVATPNTSSRSSSAKARSAQPSEAAGAKSPPASEGRTKNSTASAVRTTPRSAQASNNPPAPRAAATTKTAPATPSATPTPALTPLRVGLATICVVSALILFGLRPDALNIAWAELLRLMALLRGVAS